MTQRSKDVHASFLDNVVQTATSHCPVHAVWPLVLLFDDKCYKGNVSNLVHPSQ